MQTKPLIITIHISLIRLIMLKLYQVSLKKNIVAIKIQYIWSIT